MNYKQEIKMLCEQYGISPAKSRGQNFLISDFVYRAIVNAADIQPDETIIEAGTGFCFLTKLLAEKAKRAVSFESDRKIAAAADILKSYANIKVVHQDILKIDPSEYVKGPYAIVANLPYSITGFFLRKFLFDEKNQPQRLILMLQNEVAQRLMARSPRMNMLAILAQNFGRVERVIKVGRQNFWPVPRVDSAVIRITKDAPHSQGVVARSLDKNAFALVKIGFSHPRKMLISIMRDALKRGIIKSNNNARLEEIFKSFGLKETIRAQELTIEQWGKINKKLDY
ncbi:MAG: ribosomal RNA small subunit methyltransferase A [Parcubacteria group bacterium]|nr:ribosomal RNA small subunit methyltransferase A [Parcubacteria group bacterium]